MEQLLHETRPRLEQALDRLGQVLSRADGLLAALEPAASGGAGVAEAVAKLTRHWRTIMGTLSVISGLLASFTQVWRSLGGSRDPKQPDPPSKGGPHE